MVTSPPSTLASEKSSDRPSDRRTFTGIPVSGNKQVSGPNSQVTQRIKSFFRINNSGSESREREPKRGDGASSARADTKSSNKSLRQSRFIPHIGRNRSTTIASEGNTLEDTLSPTAHANPYFQHQGPPNLRHHNDSSVPPSPPDTAGAHQKVDGVSGAHDQQAAAGREELARKLRRVASAPNAQGLFASSKADDKQPSGDAGQEKFTQQSNHSALSLFGTSETGLLGVPSTGAIPTPGQIRDSVAFRRTYSSNSIKVRNVEVGPSSFEKVKLIGKGDVGKVYLVKEYKSQRLYAMKGRRPTHLGFCRNY